MPNLSSRLWKVSFLLTCAALGAALGLLDSAFLSTDTPRTLALELGFGMAGTVVGCLVILTAFRELEASSTRELRLESLVLEVAGRMTALPGGPWSPHYRDWLRRAGMIVKVSPIAPDVEVTWDPSQQTGAVVVLGGAVDGSVPAPVELAEPAAEATA